MNNNVNFNLDRRGKDIIQYPQLERLVALAVHLFQGVKNRSLMVSGSPAINNYKERCMTISVVGGLKMVIPDQLLILP